MGACVVVAACAQGIGSEHYARLAENWDEEKNEPKDGVHRFGSHKLSRVNALSRRIDVRIHSTMAEADVRKVFYTPCPDIGTYIEEKTKGNKSCRIAVVHDAGHTVLQMA